MQPALTGAMAAIKGRDQGLELDALLPAQETFDAMPDLVRFKFGRKTLYDLPDAQRPDPEATSAPPRLLPDFDSILLAHQDRTRVVADNHRKQLTTKNLRIKAAFLVDGRVAGTWAQDRHTITLTLFTRLTTQARDGLAAEAEALVKFVSGDDAKAAVKFG